ncbi:hypothetical protein MtrunA17_Chr5g0424831 [Medicago truncatula]|uniref:Transmembrane protein n=1 Tax=Medicago truncatula TaxID=3880 RepID=A0A396HRR5_MEDTR|nr:hypothetical protein MtrunA17_Chr5g0424831 [Medicago truncatula]
MTTLLLVTAGPSRLILLLRNFWIVRGRKDRGCLWLFSRWLWCGPVYSGFRAVVFGVVQVVVMQEFGIWIKARRIFRHVKVSALVLREFRGALMMCVGSLVGRSLLI